MELSAFKDRTVACFSVSAKSQNRIDVMLKWLSELKTKKWDVIFIEISSTDIRAWFELTYKTKFQSMVNLLQLPNLYNLQTVPMSTIYGDSNNIEQFT